MTEARNAGRQYEEINLHFTPEPPANACFTLRDK